MDFRGSGERMGSGMGLGGEGYKRKRNQFPFHFETVLFVARLVFNSLLSDFLLLCEPHCTQLQGWYTVQDKCRVCFFHSLGQAGLVLK